MPKLIPLLIIVAGGLLTSCTSTPDTHVIEENGWVKMYDKKKRTQVWIDVSKSPRGNYDYMRK